MITGNLITSNSQKKRLATETASSADEPPQVLSPARRARRCTLTLLALLLFGVAAYVGLRDAPQTNRLAPGADTPATASPEVPAVQPAAPDTDSAAVLMSAAAHSSNTPAGRQLAQ